MIGIRRTLKSRLKELWKRSRELPRRCNGRAINKLKNTPGRISMKTRISILNITLVIGLLLVSVSAFVARQRTTVSNDFKVKYKTTMGSSAGAAAGGETVTMIKGA